MLAVSAAPALAQIPVTCTSCPTEIKEIIRQGERLAEYAKMLQQGQQVVQQGRTMYDAVTNVRDLGTAFNALSALGVQNPLPINPWAAQSLMNGTGGTQGMLSSLSSLYTGNLAQNRIYDPGFNLRTFVGEQISKAAGGLAGRQATSMELYRAAADRAPVLADMQTRLAMAKTPAERDMIMAQAGLTQANTLNQLVQGVSVLAYGQEQGRLQEQQKEEYLRGKIDQQIAQGRAAGLIP
jgi:hypothetical protein